MFFSLKSVIVIQGSTIATQMSIIVTQEYIIAIQGSIIVTQLSIIATQKSIIAIQEVICHSRLNYCHTTSVSPRMHMQSIWSLASLVSGLLHINL